MATRLIINYREVDMYEEEVVALSYAVNRLTELKSRQGYFSNTFKLPKTPHNMETFGIPTELTSIDGKRFERLDAWVEDGTTRISTGYAKYQAVSDHISATFHGGNTGWLDEIRDKKLTDIDLTDLDHKVTAAIVTANRFNDYTSHFVYADVDYGLLKFIEGSIPPWFLYPAVFVKTLIDRIFSGAGWTLTNELDDETIYKKMVIPFANTAVFHTEDWVESHGFKAHVTPHSQVLLDGDITWYIGLDNDSTGGYFDTSNQITLGAWDSGFTALAGYDTADHIHQTFIFSLTFTVTSWNATYSNFLFSFANSGINPTAEQSYVHTAGVGTFTVEIRAETIEEVDQTVRVRIDDMDVSITDGYLTTVVEDTHYRDSTWEMGVNMPDMLQSDLIKHVVNSFSALLIPDEVNKGITITKFDNVPIRPVENWSDKIDLIKDPTLSTKYGSYKLDNYLKYNMDKDDRFLTATDTPGQHSIQNTFEPSGQTTIYTSPFSLVARSMVMNETMEKAAIHLHDTEVGSVGLAHFSLSITAITDAGLITVTGGANDMVEGDHITLRNINGDQQFNGLPIDGMSFKIVSIVDENNIQLSKTFTSTATATSGKVYRGIYKTRIDVVDSSNLESGYDVLFADTDGNQTIGGTALEETSTVVSKTTETSIFIENTITGSVLATTAKLHYIKDYYARRDTPPRIAIHEVVVGSSSTIDIIGSAAATDASELYFTDITWGSLVTNYWVLQSRLILKPQMVRCLMMLSASDINQLDFTKPKWIEHFGCLFYLSLVNQYKVNESESTIVELIKLP